ncbi:hypothetical protein P885DRAFT_73970 [Corynascus similis CBS 632.67]
MKREDTTKTQTQKHLSSQLSTLEILPAELKTKILSSLRSLDDLQAAIQSSPLLWHQYRTEQKIILYNVLSRLLGERVFADAYMVQKTSSLSENMPVHWFMPTHRRNSQPSIIISQCETADLISVAAFYSSVIEPLMETLPQMLLRNLSLPSLPIEVEEIACIHAFFINMYHQVLTDLRSSQAPPGSIRHRPKRRPIISQSQWQDEHLNALVSRGLAFHLSVIKHNRGLEGLTEMIPFQSEPTAAPGRPSLASSLSLAAQERRRHEPGPSAAHDNLATFQGDSEDAPPAAWTLFWDGRYGDEFGEALPLPLKSWSYVFWDRVRLDTGRGRVEVIKAMRKRFGLEPWW